MCNYFENVISLKHQMLVACMYRIFYLEGTLDTSQTVILIFHFLSFQLLLNSGFRRKDYTPDFGEQGLGKPPLKCNHFWIRIQWLFKSPR